MALDPSIIQAQAQISQQEERFRTAKTELQAIPERIKQTQAQLRRATPTSQLLVRKEERKIKGEKQKKLKELAKQEAAYQAKVAPAKKAIAEAKEWERARKFASKGILPYGESKSFRKKVQQLWGGYRQAEERSEKRRALFADLKAGKKIPGFELDVKTVGGVTTTKIVETGEKLTSAQLAKTLPYRTTEQINVLQKQLEAGGQAITKEDGKFSIGVSPSVQAAARFQQIQREAQQIQEQIKQKSPSKEFFREAFGIAAQVVPLKPPFLKPLTKEKAQEFSDIGFAEYYDPKTQLKIYRASKEAERLAKEREKITKTFEDKTKAFQDVQAQFEAGKISEQKLLSEQRKYLTAAEVYRTDPAWKGGEITTIEKQAQVGMAIVGTSPAERAAIQALSASAQTAAYLSGPLGGTVLTGTGITEFQAAQTAEEKKRAAIETAIGATIIAAPVIIGGTKIGVGKLAATETRLGITGGIGQTLVSIPTKAKLLAGTGLIGGVSGVSGVAAYRRTGDLPSAIGAGLGTGLTIGGVAGYQALRARLGVGQVQVRQDLAFEKGLIRQKAGKFYLTPRGQQFLKARKIAGQTQFSPGQYTQIVRKGWFRDRVLFSSGYSPLTQTAKQKAKLVQELVKQGYSQKAAERLITQRTQSPFFVKYDVKGTGAFDKQFRISVKKGQAVTQDAFAKQVKELGTKVGVDTTTGQVNIYRILPKKIPVPKKQVEWIPRGEAPFGFRRATPLSTKPYYTAEVVGEVKGEVYRASAPLLPGRKGEITFVREVLGKRKITGQEITFRRTTKPGQFKIDRALREYKVGDAKFEPVYYVDKSGQVQMRILGTRKVTTTFTPGKYPQYVPKTSAGQKYLQNLLKTDRMPGVFQRGAKVTSVEKVLYKEFRPTEVGQRGISFVRDGRGIRIGERYFTIDVTGTQRMRGAVDLFPKPPVTKPFVPPKTPYSVTFAEQPKVTQVNPFIAKTRAQQLALERQFGPDFWRRGAPQVRQFQILELALRQQPVQAAIPIVAPGAQFQLLGPRVEVTAIPATIQTGTVGQVLQPAEILQTQQTQQAVLTQTAQVQAPRLVQPPRTTTQQVPLIATVPTTITIQTPQLTQPPTTPTTRRTILPPSKIVSKKPVTKVVEFAEGYRVLVKRRGKFVALPGIFAKSKAIRKGERVARETLAATFKVERAGKRLRTVRDRFYAPAPTAFRSYKVVKGRRVPLIDTWIQRRGKRLGTRTEVGEIQFIKRTKRRISIL